MTQAPNDIIFEDPAEYSLYNNKIVMIKVCHGLCLDGGMRNRNWKYIWFHFDKNYETLNESEI